MSKKEYFTKLNTLAKYALGVANTNMSKIEVLFGGLKSNIAKDVIMGDHASWSYLDALSKVLKLNAMRQRMAKERRMPDQPIPVISRGKKWLPNNCYYM